MPAHAQLSPMLRRSRFFAGRALLLAGVFALRARALGHGGYHERLEQLAAQVDSPSGCQHQ